ELLRRGRELPAEVGPEAFLRIVFARKPKVRLADIASGTCAVTDKDFSFFFAAVAASIHGRNDSTSVMAGPSLDHDGPSFGPAPTASRGNDVEPRLTRVPAPRAEEIKLHDSRLLRSWG